ncbi:hypothetical protein JCM3766R1_001073 [Sporobolomyces carnicolor]
MSSRQAATAKERNKLQKKPNQVAEHRAKRFRDALTKRDIGAPELITDVNSNPHVAQARKDAEKHGGWVAALFKPQVEQGHTRVSLVQILLEAP